jgi:Outer membrane lipoprotein-sorting protein
MRTYLSVPVLIALPVLAIFMMLNSRITQVQASDQPTANAIMEGIDRVRNPGQPYRVELALTEYSNGKPRDRDGLIIYVKQDSQSRQFNNLVRYAEPPRDAGKMVLFKGKDLWFYDPNSKASIRISPQQRLMGQASEGDVLSVNLARDYTAKIVGEETLQDADHNNRDCWHLDMAAATPEAVYNHVEYWAERGTYRPIKGKFYADSGRLLKVAYYHNYREQAGEQRPAQVILIDAVNPNLATTIDYSGYRFQDIPESWLQRDYLPRLKPE